MARRREDAEKPPIAVELLDVTSLARLATSRTDYIPSFWWAPVGRRNVLYHLYSIPFWNGSIPILAYVWYEGEPAPYLVYTNLGHEEARFTKTPESGKYVNGVVIEVEETPSFVKSAIKVAGKQSALNPVTSKVSSLSSLMRLVAAMTDSTATPPIWCEEKSRIAGILYPILDYYDSTALPVFLYVTGFENKEMKGYLRYLSSDEGEVVEFTDNVSDTRYTYGRLIYAKSIPFKTS